MSIQVFTEIFDRIDSTILNTIASGTSQLISTFSPLIQAVFFVYVMFVVWSYWANKASFEGGFVDMAKRLVAWGLILGFSLNLGGYNSNVLPFVMGLGDGMAQAFSGSADSNASSLDAMASQLLDVIASNADAADAVWGIDGIGIQIKTAIKNLILIICWSIFMVIAAAYILLAKVFLAILAVLGPVFLALLLFPSTRQYGVSWINQVLNYSLLLLLLSITAAIFVTYLNETMAGMGTAEIVSNLSLLHAVLSTLLFAVILIKLPELASGLAGGVAANGFSAVASMAVGGSRVAASASKIGGRNKSSTTNKIKAENKGKN